MDKSHEYLVKGTTVASVGTYSRAMVQRGTEEGNGNEEGPDMFVNNTLQAENADAAGRGDGGRETVARPVPGRSSRGLAVDRVCGVLRIGRHQDCNACKPQHAWLFSEIDAQLLAGLAMAIEAASQQWPWRATTSPQRSVDAKLRFATSSTEPPPSLSPAPRSCSLSALTAPCSLFSISAR